MRILLLLAVAGLLLAQKIPPATFHGTVHDVSKKKMTIENEDGNLLDFDINRKTLLMRGKTEISSADGRGQTRWLWSNVAIHADTKSCTRVLAEKLNIFSTTTLTALSIGSRSTTALGTFSELRITVLV